MVSTEELQNSEKIIDYFLNNVGMLEKVSVAEGKDIMQLASCTGIYCEDIDLKTKSLSLLYYCCFYLREIEIKELWNIYWLLNYITFENNKIELRGNLDQLYRFIYKKIEKIVTDINTYERIEHSGSNLVVITTSQFLGPNHAPTRRVMDYAYAIITELKKRVMVINDAGLHFYPCESLSQYITPNYLEEYNAVSNMNYRGVDIPFMQFPRYMPDIEGIHEMVEMIYQMQPEVVYNIGASSLVSDLCQMFTKTICMPCSNNIPTAMSEYLLVGRKLVGDEERLERLESYQKVIETVVNYELPENTREYRRAEFGISEDSFVVGVIGNRLDIELTDEFIDVIENILQHTDVHFIIVGGMRNNSKIEKKISKSERLHFTGFLDEGNQAIKLFNIYCNPKRTGGGRSSFEALAQGVPVITLKHGDVYHTCGDDFAVDTYDEFSQQIDRYIKDQAYYQQVKEKALKRAEVLSDIAGTQRRILEEVISDK
ncbi:MAG: glycosyltransferase family 4 protein [Lachnospiraceae bacterium]|nr:glycosyltransferase family 4 protein [Lachnospiraceae bacterium]